MKRDDISSEPNRLGYNGMRFIHPYHVPAVNEVFTPTPEDIAEWRGLVDAMEQLREISCAAVTYGGDMVDIVPSILRTPPRTLVPNHWDSRSRPARTT